MGKRNGRNAKSPAFQVYPGDFIHNVDTAGMTAEEIGVYWLLICYAWDAPLPNDPVRLARMARLTPKKFARAWGSVSRCFDVSEKNTLTNPRQERERIFQKENHERMQDLSQKAAQARQNATSRSPYGAPHGHLPNPYSPIPIPDTLHPKPGEGEERGAPSRAVPVPDAWLSVFAEFPTLNTGEAHAAYREWIDYRKASKIKAWGVTTLRKSLRTFEGHGTALWCAAIDESIRNGWQGLFPPKRASGAPSALQHKPGGMREWFAQQDAKAGERTIDVKGAQ